jgi:hypothetical protein
MVDAGEAGARGLAEIPGGREMAISIHAPVLSNRHPPYGIAEGLYDALSDTGGFMYRVTAAGDLLHGRPAQGGRGGRAYPAGGGAGMSDFFELRRRLGLR